MDWCDKRWVRRTHNTLNNSSIQFRNSLRVLRFKRIFPILILKYICVMIITRKLKTIRHTII